MRKGGLGARRLVAPILVLPRAANVRSGWLPVVEWPHDNPIYLTPTLTRLVLGQLGGWRWASDGWEPSILSWYLYFFLFLFPADFSLLNFIRVLRCVLGLSLRRQFTRKACDVFECVFVCVCVRKIRDPLRLTEVGLSKESLVSSFCQ